MELFTRSQRRHQAVDSDLHSVLAVGLRGDESRVREGPGASNLPILRWPVVCTLRRNKSLKFGVRNKRLRAAPDESYRGELVAQLLAEAA